MVSVQRGRCCSKSETILQTFSKVREFSYAFVLYGSGTVGKRQWHQDEETCLFLLGAEASFQGRLHPTDQFVGIVEPFD